MDVTRELIEYRRRLAAYGRERPDYAAVRADLDALVCFLDEAPERSGAITRLVEKYEALLRSLAN